MARKSLFIPADDRKVLVSLSQVEVNEVESVISKIKDTTMWSNEEFDNYMDFKGEFSNGLEISAALQVLKDATYSSVGYQVSEDDLKNDILNVLSAEADLQEKENLSRIVELAYGKFLSGARAYYTLLEGGKQFVSVNSVINEKPVFTEINELAGYVIGYGLDIRYHEKDSIKGFFLNLDINDLNDLISELQRLQARRDYLVTRYKSRTIGYYHFPNEIGAEYATA